MRKGIIIISTILLTLLSGWLFLLWVVKKWNDSDPRAEQSYIRNQYKFIRLENKLDSTNIFVTVNLEYTKEDSLSYSEVKTDSFVSFSRLDSAMLIYYSSNDAIFFMPILKSDSVRFPKSFYIKIFNEDKKELLKELDFNSFIENAIPEYIANEKNPLTADKWTLFIDSTLLDLKK